ncbi:NTP transferase domain-containing protein [Cellulomonas fimi]|uniref:NTP transferase domain-containing protein n=1 Tax=Cellulomonas fimi TaxID=1708 RepID=UPI00234DD3CF|nr:NTP transferase domain-containing protein [Cellulomonas fimi]MDC7121706.1 NTP transferase domain-containing protein [Cellulomonas fimi]
MTFDAVVLAGGRARRLGGTDKGAVVVAGQALLDHALAAVAGARAIVVVGPPSVARPGVPTVQESPAFGGPVAGLAAGLAALSARTTAHPRHPVAGDASTDDDAPPIALAPVVEDAVPVDEESARDGAVPRVPPHDEDPLVVVLACDVPGAARVVPALVAAALAAPDADGARLVAADGSPQHLVAAYRRSALDAALAALPDGPRDASVRSLVAGLRLVDVPDPDDAGADADTWDDVRRLDARLSGGTIDPDDDRRTP